MREQLDPLSHEVAEARQQLVDGFNSWAGSSGPFGRTASGRMVGGDGRWQEQAGGGGRAGVGSSRGGGGGGRGQSWDAEMVVAGAAVTSHLGNVTTCTCCAGFHLILLFVRILVYRIQQNIKFKKGGLRPTLSACRG